jgi:hypothetical protein
MGTKPKSTLTISNNEFNAHKKNISSTTVTNNVDACEQGTHRSVCTKRISRTNQSTTKWEKTQQANVSETAAWCLANEYWQENNRTLLSMVLEPAVQSTDTRTNIFPQRIKEYIKRRLIMTHVKDKCNCNHMKKLHTFGHAHTYIQLMSNDD